MHLNEISDIKLAEIPSTVSIGNLTIGNVVVPIQAVFDGETIHIKTPLNIIFEANLICMNTEMGIHVNPATININEMKRTFLEAQMVKQKPFKLRVKKGKRVR